MANFIFPIVILIFSVVLHEVAHGYAAYAQGDNTAKFQGRLTLNPIKHLDLFGSIILPLLLIVTHTSFIIGWAKPVPFNPANLRNKRWGEAMVAAAGPLTNIVIALVFGLLLRLAFTFDFNIPVEAVQITGIIVLINLILAIFNLIPIPPLDGSKILFSILPQSFEGIRNVLEIYGLIIVIFFALFFWQHIAPVVSAAFVLITGVYF